MMRWYFTLPLSFKYQMFYLFCFCLSFLNFEPNISKSRSMESLLSINEASCFDESSSSAETNDKSHNVSGSRHRRTSPGSTSATRTHARNPRAKFIAEIDEVRVNPIVSKKGYLNFLEEKSIGWSKKFVVRFELLFKTW